MNREIKFNYLFREHESDILHSKTFDYAEIFNGYAKAYCDSNLNSFIVAKRQYTGLKDKNGKEIYEGDILKTPSGLIGSVYYHNERASFIFHDTENYNEQLFNKAHSIEIIGNIYEHQHLLSKQEE